MVQGKIRDSVVVSTKRVVVKPELLLSTNHPCTLKSVHTRQCLRQLFPDVDTDWSVPQP